MKRCNNCNRPFGNEEALKQHIRDSSAHAPSYDCDPCNRSFVSEEALKQHIRDSSAHAPSYDCDPCNRSFVSEEALKQHIRDSSAHAPSYDCDTCNRSFVSEEALKKHIRYSSAHAHPYDCDACNQSFVSEEALTKHIQYSSAHAPSYDCDTCNRSFVNKEALEQHIQNSSAHVSLHDTPLDNFFLSFPTFAYDPALSPAKSYAHLRQHFRWQRGDTDSDEAWDRYQNALREEFELWFGAEDDLSAWHALCRAIKIKPLPTTCDGCEKAVRNRHVNLVDLIEWARRSGNSGEADIQIFRSIAELTEYSKLLRHLLRRMFRAHRKESPS